MKLPILSLIALMWLTFKNAAGRTFKRSTRLLRRLRLQWHLRRLDFDDNEIRDSLVQEEQYLSVLDKACADLLERNNRRRYSLKRRLMALDSEELP
jgi:hypothetical protein